MQINRGFRVEFNSALGPYKGGLRFHPSVYLGIIKFLGFEQIFKNALTGLPIGGGKGGSDFDPKGKSDNEVMRFCQSFMTELWRHIGEYTDVPAGDIGVGGREIGYMFGQYKRITQPLRGRRPHRQGARLRRLAGPHRGHRLRRHLLRRRDAEGPQGLASRARPASSPARATSPSTPSRRSHQLGGKVVACSDSNGVHLRREGHRPRPREAAQGGRAPPHQGLRRRTTSTRSTSQGGNIWEIPCQVAMPSATQNEINGKDAATPREERLHRGRRGREHAHHARGHQGVPRRQDRLRPGQGRQRRRRGHLRARDAAERDAATPGPSSTPRSGSRTS